MLTQNFYSQVGGGRSSSTGCRRLAVINTNKTRVFQDSGFVCQLLNTGSNSFTYSTAGTSVANNCRLAIGNTTDTGFTLPDTIYTTKDIALFGKSAKCFPITDNTTSIEQITGAKITDTIQNTTSSDITINYIALLDKTTNDSVLALKLLDTPITLKPTETFVAEYTLDNLYPVIPDTV